MGFWHWIANALSDWYQEDGTPSRPRSGQAAVGGGGAPAALEDPGAATATAVKEPEGPSWWEREEPTATDPAPLKRPELTPEATALENGLCSQLDGHNLDLPPIPRVAERVLRLLGHRDYKAAEVASVISDDQVAATALLRLANSAMYAGTTKITAVLPAVSRLGSKAVRTVMMQQFLRAATSSLTSSRRQFAELIWSRSVVRAHIMGGLAELTQIDQGEACLMGLLHDIGNLMVVREMERQAAFTDYTPDLDTFEYLCFECHQEFGELIADAWHLPLGLKALISDHHSVPELNAPMRTERLQLQLSDMLCSMTGHGPEAEYRLMESRPVRGLGLDGHEGFKAYLNDLPAQIDANVNLD